jgi:flagellar hook assembly protein FlgD
MQNYPNPFNPETIISYHLPQKGKVEVIIYDVQGKEVTTLENTIKEGGDYRVTWNGRTNTGAKASSGMYFYQIIFEKKSLTKKMLLIR